MLQFRLKEVQGPRALYIDFQKSKEDHESEMMFTILDESKTDGDWDQKDFDCIGLNEMIQLAVFANTTLGFDLFNVDEIKNQIAARDTVAFNKRLMVGESDSE